MYLVELGPVWFHSDLEPFQVADMNQEQQELKCFRNESKRNWLADKLKRTKKIFSTLNTGQYQYADSPYCSLYISYSTYMENLSNNQELLSVVDHFLYSCDLIV